MKRAFKRQVFAQKLMKIPLAELYPDAAASSARPLKDHYFQVKKLLAIFTVLLLIPSVFSFGKDKHKTKQKSPALPVVRVGSINSYMTTRAEILSNPRLTIDSPCAIAGFSVSLVAPGHDFFGPLYAHGTDFTELQISKIKEWDYPNVTIYIEDIHCNCHEQDYAPAAIVLKYDH